MDYANVESTVGPVRSQFDIGYITSYKSNLESLKIDVKKLEASKISVQNSVEEAERNGEVILDDVKFWLKKVDATVAEAKKLIIENDVHANRMRYFTILWFRHQQSKKSQKMIQEIHQVIAEGKFERVSYSKVSTLQAIQQALKDPNIFKIGLYGTDGVGKTTLVKELTREVEKDGSFDAVVLAEVTDSPDVEDIQGQIANALGLNFDEETKEGSVEQLLRQRIKKEKNILVILDDIWGELDLTALGIPFGNDHEGCKLLLTSEYRNVLKRHMGTQKDFRLEVLSDEDSWKLFDKIAGDDIKFNDINQSIAQDVVKCCKGLPLFIYLVAKALREKIVATWKDALKQLKGLDEQGFFKEVVCPLEFSYNYLASDELRSLFLFIVSFGPGRIHTGELFSCYWGLMGDLQSLTKARNNFYRLINDLRDSSLLLEEEIEYVRIHDAVREMAKAIASRTELTFEVRKFTQMEQWDMDQLQKCHSINLPSYNVDELPEKLVCPELKLMSLRRNHGYLTIPDNFFSGMREVKVLNLHGMRFVPSPPPSLSLLTNLISLSLYGCILEDIAMVAKVTRLEVLTLERSEIQELPKEIGQLVYLRMLNLTNCCQLKTIPANLLSSLTRLEELYMGNCCIQWEVEGEKGQTNNASLGELKNLNHLTTLDLSISDASVLPVDMNVFANLQRYNIFIGHKWKWSSFWSGDAHETSRTLKLADSLNTKICSNQGIRWLFTTVEDLSLDKLNFVDGVSYKLSGKRFLQLRHLQIQNNDGFHNLERLILSKLHNMEDISYGTLPTHSFEKLQVIKVKHCHKLKKLLSYSFASYLSQLHDMKIFECNNIEEVISEEKNKNEKEIPHIMLPKLQSLTLNTLPRLHSFCFPLTTDKHDRSFPVPLFSQKVTMPNLETLELCSINTCKIWDDKLPLHSCIQNLTSLKIDSCSSIRNLFTSSVARALVKLQHLRITFCPELEDIFVREEKLTFPNNLDTLSISDNDKLRSIWPNQLAPNSFFKLKKLQIHGTKILDHVFPVSVVGDLQQLQVLEISRCRINNIVEKTNSHDVENIYCEKLDVSWCYKLETVVSSSVSFQTLDELKVDNCGVANIIIPSMTPSLPNLRILSISSCTKLEDIFGKNNKSYPPGDIALMKLEELELKSLPILTSFCRESCNFNFPSLRKVCVVYCSMIVTFCHGNLTVQSPDTTNQHALFNEMVAMPNLETLELSYLNARNIWDGNLPDHFYKRNFSLTVNHCHSLKSLFSSTLATALDKLQHLEILSCDELVQIFTSDEELTTFPELERLVINNMNKLLSIWNNQQASNSFHKLNKIEITKCPVLLHVFPIVVAKELRQLQVLKISTSDIKNIVGEISDNIQDVESTVYIENLVVSKCNRLETVLQSSVQFQTLYKLDVSRCDEVINILNPLMVTNLPRTLCILNVRECHKLEQVFGKNNERDAVLGENQNIAFITKLEELHLEDLPRLTNFYNGSYYNFNFPSLRSLHVIGCLKMKTFVHQGNLTTTVKHELRGDQKGQNNDKLNNPSFATPLFNEKVAMPSLEFLKLSNLMFVILFSPSTAKTLVRLQHLEISRCNELVELFIQKEEVAFPNLETLSISSMGDLKSIWKNQQAPNSFCKLNNIQIGKCDGLHHVFPIVVAKELRQLQVLEIWKCNNIETIVENSDSSGDAHEIASTKLAEQKAVRSGNRGEAPAEIVFMKLEELELYDLRRLTSFCKTSYNFNFPALQTVSVVDCPNMKTFCHGNVITPSLSKVTYRKTLDKAEKEIWDGNLNTTLERAAKET